MRTLSKTWEFLLTEEVGPQLKTVGRELGASEEQQLRNYMKILGIRFGLLINFQHPGRKQGKTRLEIREISLG